MFQTQSFFILHETLHYNKLDDGDFKCDDSFGLLEWNLKKTITIFEIGIIEFVEMQKKQNIELLTKIALFE